jgi:hypothetical protein
MTMSNSVACHKACNDMTFCYCVVFFVILAIFIEGCHSNNDNLIVPGKRVGDCVLLKTRSKGAESSNDLGCGMYHSAEGALNGLDFSFDVHSGFLIGVGVTDSRYQTRSGIHVGDDMSRMINIEGPGIPVAFVYHYYKNQPSSGKPVLTIGHLRARRYPGIIFALNKQGHVGGIWIGSEESLSAMSCPVNPSTYSLLPSSRVDCRPEE